MKRTLALILALLLLSGLLAGCGGTETTAPTEPPETTEEPTPEPAPEVTEEPAPQGLEGRGAESLEEIIGFLTAEDLFTPEQVNCMSFEMLLACVSTCDPENGLALLEDYDPAAIALLLNERLFPIVGGRVLRYGDIEQQSMEMSDELRQGVLDWFEQQKDGVTARYGEENYRRIQYETAGYEVFHMCSYTLTDPEGARRRDGIVNGNTNGLNIIRIRGRYYWTAFDLFTGDLLASEPSEPDPELPRGELTETDEGYRYENRALGFGILLNDDWFQVKQEKPKDGAGSHLSFIDLSAQRKDWTAGLNIGVDDIAVPGGLAETPEEYRDSSIPGIWELTEEIGLTDVSLEACQLRFLGKDCPGLEFFGKTPMQDWYCRQINFTSGHYMITVTLSTYDDNWLDELTEMFYPLD